MSFFYSRGEYLSDYIADPLRVPLDLATTISHNVDRKVPYTLAVKAQIFHERQHNKLMIKQSNTHSAQNALNFNDANHAFSARSGGNCSSGTVGNNERIGK